MRADTFLSLYRVVEGALENKYSGDDKRLQSVVMEYINDPESEPVRSRLNVCREIRNLLTHNADSDGNHLIEPSQQALDDLYEVLRYIQTPQPALAYATVGDSIMRVSPNERVFDLMRRMEKHGYSHVPVIDNGRMIGVFSVISVFSYALTGAVLRPDTRIREFGKLLNVDGQRSGRFITMGREASYMDVRAAFERDSERNNRLAVVFITSTGDLDGELLGMLTPWDVMGDKPS